VMAVTRGRCGRCGTHSDAARRNKLRTMRCSSKGYDMVDRDTLAAIGEVVVDAAVLQYWIAVLVAAAEGTDEDRARQLLERPGAALRALEKLAQERTDFVRVYRDAKAVLDDRNVLAHSVNFIEEDADLEPGYSIWNPRHDAEVRITRQQILEHSQDIRIAVRRARDLFISVTSGDP
jgi:hypothetical protein